MKKIYLYPGQFVIQTEEVEISTILGSCVAVVLFDRQRGVGGMNHFLLPEQPPQEKSSARYGRTATVELVEEMLRSGSKPRDLQAKIYGGGNVLSGVQIGEGIGNRNIQMARDVLNEFRIPILDQNTGGVQSRKIILNSKTFQVDHQFLVGQTIDTSGCKPLEKVESVKVLIVDDSATVRSIFSRIFQKHGIEVVGVAANALEAREMIVKHRPQVLTLDLEMPHMSGVSFLEKLMTHYPLPVVVVSSLSSQGEAAVKCMDYGAIEFVHKPSQYDPKVLSELGLSLVEKVRAASLAKVSSRKKDSSKESKGGARVADVGQIEVIRRSSSQGLRCIVVSGNTGSADSMTKFLAHLPSDSPPVVISNSTVAPFLSGYISSIAKTVRLGLDVAADGQYLQMGHVYFAPTTHHVELVSHGSDIQIKLSRSAMELAQKPSGNILFQSAAREIQGNCVGILLSSFGSDGVKGLESLHSAGAFTMVERPDLAQFPYGPQQCVNLGVVGFAGDPRQFSSIIDQVRSKKVVA